MEKEGTLMKKILCALLVLLLVGCVSAAMAEGCIYDSLEYPCEPGWEVDRQNQQHRRICFRHIEDKEDAFSHMPITEWESCTLDEGGKCTGCGMDYEEDIVVDPDELPDEELAIYMLEMYLFYLEENGIPPVEVSASGSKLTVKLTSGYFEYLDAMGIPYSETMAAKTTYTLSLPQGLTYPYNGQAVTPEVDMDASEYGPGAWLKEMGLMVFEVAYRNNKAPGTATALVEVYLEGGESYTLQQNFTITGEGGSEGGEDDPLYCKYGSASSPCEIVWDANAQLKQHSAYCVAHVEDKEDMYSYVQVTDWEDCTLDAKQVCTVCGANYAPQEPETPDYDAEMKSIYNRLLERNGTAPLEVSVTDNYATIKVNDHFVMYMLERGIPLTDEVKEATVFTLTLPDGDEYPYEGRPVFPETSLDMSPDGPGAWLKRAGLMYNDSVQYENNQAPGTALAKMVLHVDGVSPINLVAEYTIVGAVGEHCKYYAPDSPCDVIWWVDNDDRLHCRACRNHVEDKEDPGSYVRLTEWTPCTLDAGGECTGCGWDYVKEPDEDNSHIYMLEYYMMLSAEMGSAPVKATVSGNELTIGMHKDFFTALERAGVPVSESMMVDTTYTLTLPSGNTYAFDGAPVTPAVTVEKSEYGPGAWFDKVGLLEIGEPVYSNNTAPGTATVSVDISLKKGQIYTLTTTFTITGEGGNAPELPGDADGDNDVSLSDALDLLRVIAGEDVSINTANADVNGDGKADLQDVLLILQYVAGWNVSLK